MPRQPCIQAIIDDRRGFVPWICRAVIAVAIITLFLPAPFAAARAESPTVSEPAPDFALKSQSGSNLRLSEYRGDVVLVNFWMSECSRCRDQLAGLAALGEANRQDRISILSINVDGDSRASIRVSADQGYEFPVLFDTDKSVVRLYDPSRLPMTVVIDPHGIIRYIHEGYERGDDALYARELRELLAE